jgi:hypothetical protein
MQVTLPHVNPRGALTIGQSFMVYQRPPPIVVNLQPSGCGCAHGPRRCEVAFDAKSRRFLDTWTSSLLRIEQRVCGSVPFQPLDKPWRIPRFAGEVPVRIGPVVWSATADGSPAILPPDPEQLRIW